MANDRAALNAKCQLLRKLHQGPGMLVLPNAWDAASAKVFEKAGFPAIATTSGGVALALGHEDHEQAPSEAMFEAAQRITAAVSIPVSVDLEAGYGLSPAAFVERAIAAGAAGFNMEDTNHHGAETLVQADQQAERIRQVRASATAAGVELVINARTDPLLHRVGDPAEQLAEAIRRANLYLEAGADSVYPFGFYDETVTAALVHGINGPINVVNWRNAVPLARLAELGVRRVTFATSIFRDMTAVLEEKAAGIFASLPAPSNEQAQGG